MSNRFNESEYGVRRIIDFFVRRRKYLIISIVAIFAVPMITSLIISLPFGNLAIGDEESWVSFFGGYIGAVIGAIATVYVFSITMKYNQKKDKDEEIRFNKQIEEERKRFDHQLKEERDRFEYQLKKEHELIEYQLKEERARFEQQLKEERARSDEEKALSVIPCLKVRVSNDNLHANGELITVPYATTGSALDYNAVRVELKISNIGLGPALRIGIRLSGVFENKKALLPDNAAFFLAINEERKFNYEFKYHKELEKKIFDEGFIFFLRFIDVLGNSYEQRMKIKANNLKLNDGHKFAKKYGSYLFSLKNPEKMNDLKTTS